MPSCSSSRKARTSLIRHRPHSPQAGAPQSPWPCGSRQTSSWCLTGLARPIWTASAHHPGQVRKVCHYARNVNVSIIHGSTGLKAVRPRSCEVLGFPLPTPVGSATKGFLTTVAELGGAKLLFGLSICYTCLAEVGNVDLCALLATAHLSKKG